MSFLNTESELRSYFLGLFMADGWINKNGFFISLIDEELIYNLAQQTNNKYKITECKNKVSKTGYRIGFYDKEDIDKMIKIGFSITERKTGNEFIPSCIDIKDFHHFLRGMSDGDGHFSLVKNRNIKQLEWGVTCANRNFLQYTLNFLIENSIISCEGHSVRERYNKNCYKISTGHHDSIRIGSFLYNQANIFLERKKTVYENAKLISFKKNPKWTKKELELTKDNILPEGRTKAAMYAKIRILNGLDG
jgi:hypothetical protein